MGLARGQLAGLYALGDAVALVFLTRVHAGITVWTIRRLLATAATTGGMTAPGRMGWMRVTAMTTGRRKGAMGAEEEQGGAQDEADLGMWGCFHALSFWIGFGF